MKDGKISVSKNKKIRSLFLKSAFFTAAAIALVVLGFMAAGYFNGAL